METKNDGYMEVVIDDSIDNEFGTLGIDEDSV